VAPDLPPSRADGSLDAELDASSDVPADAGLPPPPTATGVAAGSAFSCLSLSDGTARCWGTNRAYELGNGRVNEGGPALTAVIASPGAATTNPLQGVTRVASGLATSCALLQDRSVRCWGANEMGALGIGNLSEQNGPVAMTW
jgi:alpha-tubulin suppressor-like RCC1 family protein